MSAVQDRPDSAQGSDLPVPAERDWQTPPAFFGSGYQMQCHSLILPRSTINLTPHPVA